MFRREGEGGADDKVGCVPVEVEEEDVGCVEDGLRTGLVVAFGW